MRDVKKSSKVCARDHRSRDLEVFLLTPTMLVQHVELVGWKATDNGGYWTLLLHAL